MTRHQPAADDAPEPTVMEQQASRYLEALPRDAPDGGQDHPLAPALRQVERRAIGWAVFAGLVSGGLVGGAEIVARGLASDGPAAEGWLADWEVWAGFFAVAGLVSAIEILFLYWNAFRAIARFVGIAGTRLSGHPHGELVARGLARGGLEFPNPQTRIMGIDPFARVPRWQITARNLLYKMKVGASSFVIRLFLRRVFGRMMVRGLIPLFAGPLYAAWNALITWWICREARLRVLGPHAVEELVGGLALDRDHPDPAFADLVLQGVGELVMRGRDAHPNFVLLLSRLRESLDHDEDEIKVDWDKARQALGSLGEPQRSAAMATWTLTAILGSRTRTEQGAFLADAASACRLEFDPAALPPLRRRLLAGERLALPDLAAAPS